LLLILTPNDIHLCEDTARVIAIFERSPRSILVILESDTVPTGKPSVSESKTSMISWTSFFQWRGQFPT